MGSRLGWGVYRLFTTADDRQVFIAITSNGHWQRFCKEFGLKTWPPIRLWIATPSGLRTAIAPSRGSKPLLPA